MSTKITVGKEDYLLDVENSKLEQAHKVYFGSYFGNNMEASTDIYNNIRNFTIVSLEKAIIGTPEIKKAEKVEELECVRIPDDKGDSFQFEFDFYVDDDSITIVNIEKKNEPVNMVCERDRVEYGLNNQDIVYIKIKDLTKEEHDDFMKTLKENDVEIERKTSEVEKVLEESEETEDISIVQASMIGSRGWGYEDKESDIDIRFIFVRDPRDYISILQHEDSIAYPIEDKKDIVGYDLGKFLRMICNQNPTASKTRKRKSVCRKIKTIRNRSNGSK